MWIIKLRKIFYSLSIALTAGAIALLVMFGLKFGIDFTGGSVLEVSYESEKPAQADIESAIASFDLGSSLVRETGENGYLIQTKTIDNATKESIKTAISFNGTYAVTEEQFNTIGPALGQELRTKAIVAIIVLLLVTIIFIAFAFRQVSKPVSSWKYGFIAMIALAHDVLLTVGFFALFGLMHGTEVDTLFVMAILVILGYSINDTIIILDRVRENLANSSDQEKNTKFTEIVGRSLTETMTRSINTTLTVILSLLALFFFGPEATKVFTLALIVGVVAGAYSSIFIAAPLLVTFNKKKS